MIVSSISEVVEARNKFVLFLALVFSGNYVAGGDTLDLTQVQDTQGQSVEGFFEVPQNIGVFSVNLGGYRVEIIPGATLAAFKIKVYVGTTGLELAAGAYPGAITGGTLTLLATRRAM